jgi:hypothetical protein
MTRDDIIRMAREAGIGWLERAEGITEFLERFANLVAAAEREAFDAKYPIQLTHDQYNVVINAALKDEREACAKVCEAEGERVDASWVSCAFAIRKRGQQ